MTQLNSGKVIKAFEKNLSDFEASEKDLLDGKNLHPSGYTMVKQTTFGTRSILLNQV